jgi:hypothetical protein
MKHLVQLIKISITLFCFLITTITFSQDVAVARKVVDTLTSPFFWGRGYTNNGMEKAAGYLAKQFSDYGLQPIKGKGFLQQFSFPVNTFPGRMELSINNKKLVPGKDFIVAPESKSLHARGDLREKDSTHYVNTNYRIIISFEDKLTWSVSPELADYTLVQVDKKSIAEIPINFKVEIENKFIENFKAANVAGMVKGTVNPDSFMVITAHYDHLGGMGKETFFPGANDNASGTSLLLGLAKHYAANPPPYSIAFICFAAEEAGLIGSKYFTENPLIPLQNISFLLNIDLAGTGEEGITVVNATEYPKQFDLLNQVNNKGNYLAKINARGKAANSDHYWFSEKGVPAFFIYTLGGIKAYHDVFDIAETLPLNEYEDLFKLITGFNSGLMEMKSAGK